MDILALRISSMVDWLYVILHPQTIGIPASDSYFFQIFAAVACDQIWYAKNKAHHENLVPNALSISAKINRISKEHYHLLSRLITAIWKTFSAQSTACRDF
jgi:hypothetical protein